MPSRYKDSKTSQPIVTGCLRSNQLLSAVQLEIAATCANIKTTENTSSVATSDRGRRKLEI
jgi:hypothetical protein